jgi:membrane protease YdiL (CAAX protease family)
VALLLPVIVTAFRSGIEQLLGARGPVQWQPINALPLVVFVMVAGEEIGWRGFALPRLLERFGPWRASATLGVLWALWHLPLFYMRGMPQYGSPFGAYVLYLVALSLVMTFLLQRADGSIVIATLFHGAVNTFGFVNDGAGALVRGWSNAISYAVAALVMRLVLRGDRVAVPGNGNLARVDRVR